MPLTIYTQLTSKMQATTRVRLSFAGHSYVYPLGIAEDVLVNVAGFMYPVDFMIVDDKGSGCIPIILGAPFLTTARAIIRYEKREIELKSGKRQISFPMTPRYARESLMKRMLNNNIDTSPNHVQKKFLHGRRGSKVTKKLSLREVKAAIKVMTGMNVINQRRIMYHSRKGTWCF